MRYVKPVIGLSFAALVAGGLFACASAPQASGGDTTFTPAPPAASQNRPVARSESAPSQRHDHEAPQSATADDRCAAAGLQYLVGRPRTEIPVPLDPGKRRVVCSSCIITQDYRPDRQTITFDTDSGLIKSVACG